MSLDPARACLQQMACRACYGACCKAFMYPAVFNDETDEADPGMTTDFLGQLASPEKEDGKLAGSLFVPYNKVMAVKLLDATDHGRVERRILPVPPEGYSWRVAVHHCKAYDEDRQICTIYDQKRPYACGMFHCSWTGGEFPSNLLANRLTDAEVIRKCEKKLARFIRVLKLGSP